MTNTPTEAIRKQAFNEAKLNDWDGAEYCFDAGWDAAIATMQSSSPSGLVEALEPFAKFADPRRMMPESMPITQGSGLARKQLTMGDCYRAADALATLSPTMETGK